MATIYFILGWLIGALAGTALVLGIAKLTIWRNL